MSDQTIVTTALCAFLLQVCALVSIAHAVVDIVTTPIDLILGIDVNVGLDLAQESAI